MCVCKQDLSLNNPQELTCHKTQPINKISTKNNCNQMHMNIHHSLKKYD